MKKVLITGENSYLGESLGKWLLKNSDAYQIHTLDLKDSNWKMFDFHGYDSIFHVAGIAHVSTDPKMEDLYFKINRDLAIETAKKAKENGVKQFIFMSSIIVYGNDQNNNQIIDADTIPNPENFYGMSKLQAEEGIQALASDHFKIVILRPPMVYGKGSKGNYPRLSKFAQKSPVFPDFNNERSMVHIDNLCEFIKAMIDFEESGLFFPQNREYVSTSQLVKTIAQVHNRKMILTKIFNPLINRLFGLNIVGKVFGTLVYDKEMSKYENANYQVRNLLESIELTERK
jgi:UDP-glucose 4-epimerase